jgi:hypothetical protein
VEEISEARRHPQQKPVDQSRDASCRPRDAHVNATKAMDVGGNIRVATDADELGIRRARAQEAQHRLERSLIAEIAKSKLAQEANAKSTRSSHLQTSVSHEGAARNSAPPRNGAPSQRSRNGLFKSPPQPGAS